MKQIAHTKTPFKITHPLPTSLFIEDEIGSVICQFPDYAIDREANAAHIVRCVNSHESLVNALEYVLQCNQENFENMPVAFQTAINICEQALAAARGDLS